jgi:cell division septation protein DedD
VPPPPVDELSYFNRLEKPNPPVERLNKPAPEKPARVDARRSFSASRPEAGPTRRPRRRLPAATAGGACGGAGPSTSGFAVQVAALNVRSEADAMVKRLLQGLCRLRPGVGRRKPPVFRVRIGSFKTRREADAIVAKLQKEEQIKPWVTR